MLLFLEVLIELDHFIPRQEYKTRFWFLVDVLLINTAAHQADKLRLYRSSGCYAFHIKSSTLFYILSNCIWDLTIITQELVTVSFLTWTRGIPGSISSKQDWYSTLPSDARRTKCGRSVLQGKSNLRPVSRTCAHSLTNMVPDKRYFFNRSTWISIYSSQANSGNIKPVLLWSYCWKPKISSERWVNNFSFRALRAEPSAALTLWSHRPRYIICIHVFYLVSATVNPDTRCTSESGWVCAWNGWLDTDRSGASVLGPLWCTRLGCSPPHSNLTQKRLWWPRAQNTDTSLPGTDFLHFSPRRATSTCPLWHSS